jgi:hypothetical protein
MGNSIPRPGAPIGERLPTLALRIGENHEIDVLGSDSHRTHGGC